MKDFKEGALIAKQNTGTFIFTQTLKESTFSENEPDLDQRDMTEL